MSESSTPSEKPNPIPPRTPDTPTKLYTGGCHCGRFQFECRHPILESGFEVVSCNCSICTQRGYLIIYILDPSDFKFLKGSESELAGYQFNTKVLTHKFCPSCGTGLFARGEDAETDMNIIGLNVRTIADLDLENLKLKKMNGRARNAEQMYSD